MMREFFQFLQKYGVVGLAIAVIIGGRLNSFVSSLVNDLITPLLLQPVLGAAGVANINKLQMSGIYYGRVLSSFLEFMIVAFIVFLFSKKIMREEEAVKK